MRGKTGKPYEEDRKTSSLESIQARQAAFTQKVGETAASGRDTLRDAVRWLQLVPSLPDNDFVRRRQDQIDAESGPDLAA